ncbi:unnamed protein product [Candidula unifasciata]|uniref:Ribonuclease H1 n=1 Tax=Candidula unifasciata TaxID=100452 RepID=A0A8S3Z5U0_9EUPU|nr:unnamed protein product [Candidula unifasciata]
MIRFIVSFSASLFRAMPKSEPTFYAVKRGRVPGVYSTWSECENQVKGFPNPAFRKFLSYEAAYEFTALNASSNATLQPVKQEDTSFAFQVSKALTNVSTFSCPDASQKAPVSSTSCSNCSQCQNVATVASLSSAVEDMKASIQNIYGVVEKLSVGLTEVQSTVCRLEKTFMAPGSKRAFCTSAANESRQKRPKFDNNKDCFTGSKFLESEGSHVYTDGGCFDNGRNGARAGIGVFWARNDVDNVSERLPGRPTNNRAEIHAAVRAVQIAKKKGIQNLILHTDSQFLINGITKWIRGWKRNQWKKTTGSPVINQKDFEELDKELQGINVKWVHVRGHSGDPSNDEADLLARQGAAKLEESTEHT